MKKFAVLFVLSVFCGLIVGPNVARAQQAASKNPGPEKILLRNWNGIGGKIIAMAEDWPEDKYGYRPNDQVRTFGQMLLHLANANYYATNPALGKSTDNIENDPKEYKTKAEIVAFVKKTFADGAAALEQGGDEGAMKNLGSWVGIIEHSGEHYGSLVTYYRNNGVVPPSSRPKK
ncbi:MAG TPA: DinB family protein [Candidatus Acidoferrales bacterium]|nr:DinB family protein [Candidatus Acidoferrales bacterium]